jgi:hypothetical protein
MIYPALTFLLLTMVSVPTLAQTYVEADNYPVNFNHCDYQLVEPAGSGGYRLSRDCKTVYVLPGAIGRFTAEVRLSDSVLKHNCTSFELIQEYYLSKSLAVRKTQERLFELEAAGTNKKEIARLQAIVDRLQNELREVKDPFRDVSGGQAYIKMDAGVTTELVEQFTVKNIFVVTSRNIKVVPMPIRNGYLTFTEYTPAAETKFPSTLAVHVNGVLVKGEGTNQNMYRTTSSMGGHLVLGMSLACDLYKKQTEMAKIGREPTPVEIGKTLISEIAPTFSYSYPMMSTLKYDATLDIKRATELVLDTTKIKGEFRLSQYTEMLGRGKATDIFRMDIDLGELGDRFTNKEKRESLLNEMTAEVRDRLTIKFMRELASIGLVEYKPLPIGEVPNPGFDNIPVGTVRTCSQESFMGIPTSRSCRDHIVTRRVPVNGELKDILRKFQDFNISVAEHLSLHELVLNLGNVIFSTKEN